MPSKYTTLKVKSVDELLKRKWTPYILRSLVSPDGQPIRWSCVKDRVITLLEEERKKGKNLVFIDDRTLTTHLNTLCMFNVIKKHGKKGYSYGKEVVYEHFLKIQDKDAIENYNMIFNGVLPFGRLEEEQKKELKNIEYKFEKDSNDKKSVTSSTVYARYLTIYSQGKPDSDIYKKVKKSARAFIEELYDIVKRKYEETLLSLTEQECDKIDDDNIKKCLRQWAITIIEDKGLLHPTRTVKRNSKSHYPKTLLKIKNEFDLSYGLFSELETIARRIMDKIEKKYHPMLMLIRF